MTELIATRDQNETWARSVQSTMKTQLLRQGLLTITELKRHTISPREGADWAFGPQAAYDYRTTCFEEMLGMGGNFRYD